MPTRSSTKKKAHDVNTVAFDIVNELTSDEPLKPEADSGKNPAAVELGRLGGQKGGKARAAKLSPKQRKEIAKKAAEVRWGKK